MMDGHLDRIRDVMEESTLIDAGHYSLVGGPTPLQLYMWQLGVAAYVQCTRQDRGLALLVDDMHRIGEFSKKERDALRTSLIPGEYREVLEQYGVDAGEVDVVKQSTLRNAVDDLANIHGARCEFIVAENIRRKEKQGYRSIVSIYDAEKTDGGIKMRFGAARAYGFFHATVVVHQFIFHDRNTVKYARFTPQNPEG